MGRRHERTDLCGIDCVVQEEQGPAAIEDAAVKGSRFALVRGDLGLRQEGVNHQRHGLGRRDRLVRRAAKVDDDLPIAEIVSQAVPDVGGQRRLAHASHSAHGRDDRPAVMSREATSAASRFPLRGR